MTDEQQKLVERAARIVLSMNNDVKQLRALKEGLKRGEDVESKLTEMLDELEAYEELITGEKL